MALKQKIWYMRKTINTLLLVLLALMLIQPVSHLRNKLSYSASGFQNCIRLQDYFGWLVFSLTICHIAQALNYYKMNITTYWATISDSPVLCHQYSVLGQCISVPNTTSHIITFNTSQSCKTCMMMRWMLRGNYKVLVGQIYRLNSIVYY